MIPTPEMITRAATALCNARGARRGAPAISNVLDMLAAEVRAVFVEDATAALTVALKDLKVRVPQKSRDPDAPKQPRPRNVLMDTLALIEGHHLDQVTPPAWSKFAKALKDIKAVNPDVTPEELKRRAVIYKKNFPDMMLTATSLSSWWGKCAETAGTNGKEIRKADNVR